MATEKQEFRSESLREQPVNCTKLLSGDANEQERILSLRRQTTRLSNQDYISATQDCDSFVADRAYVTHSSFEELSFPLAFSLMMHKEVDRAERLLRMIYRPHNFYCVHVDAKAAPDVRAAMQGIAQCLPNVFLSSRSIDVRWSEFTMVEPDLVCMQDLFKFSWK